MNDEVDLVIHLGLVDDYYLQDLINFLYQIEGGSDPGPVNNQNDFLNAIKDYDCCEVVE